ncbi:MAG: J domain-containing protein [Hyphomicrobiaceae bacterium]|nr:J domain-containing protein [Hyphomicrobiaceae bacterium]
MASDPYGILGLQRSATDDEVRAAFRRLAKTSHPDLHPGDSAAAERFKKLSAAYDILGDAEKRRQFDAGLIDASGEPVRGFAQRHRGQPGAQPHARAGTPGGGPFSDIFSDIFGEGGFGGPRQGHPGFRARGQDVRYTLEVDFLEAISGTRKRVTMPDGGVLDLVVPEGVVDGQVLRLKGKGKPGLGGGEVGDALVEIHVRPHADYTRSGDDITMNLPVSLDEAILGGRIEVGTPTGRVHVTLPKGTSSGQVFRLRGKGARNTATGKHGDLLASVRIVLPEKIDDGLAYFISEWRNKNRYDPRGK